MKILKYYLIFYYNRGTGVYGEILGKFWKKLRKFLKSGTVQKRNYDFEFLKIHCNMAKFLEKLNKIYGNFEKKLGK